MIQFRFIYVSKGLVQPPTIAAQLGDGCHDSIPSAVRLLDFFERLARRHAGTAAAQASRRGAEGGNYLIHGADGRCLWEILPKALKRADPERSCKFPLGLGTLGTYTEIYRLWHALSVKHYSQNFCRLALGENDRRTSDSDLLQIVGRCRCLPFPPMVLYRNICVHPQVAATIVSAWEILERSWWHLGTWSGA